MYKISIPVMLHDRLEKEKILKILQECKAERIFLAAGVPSINPKERSKTLERLRELVPYFQKRGLEVGIWFWSFWRKGLDADEAEDYLMADGDGHLRFESGKEEKNSGFCCPAAPKAIAATMDIVTEFTAVGADLLLLDDDYRFGFYDLDAGCFCKAHMKLYEKKFGKKVSRKEILAGIYEKRPNKTRRQVLDVLGESLENYALQIRKAADSINPKIRIGLCSVMSLWDTDGADSVRIAKILAGNTRPLIRLTGAPYWAAEKSWGNRLWHAIELERMEYAWTKGNDIETMTEGDVYPRPRHRVPASYLEGFDTALRAAGVGDGILKYMLDYTSSIEYETVYVKRHQENFAVYSEISRIFLGKKAVGVRVYEYVNKLKECDLLEIENPKQYVQNQFFSVAARMLADNTIPVTYEKNDGAGIAFGENVRYLPESALDNGLILDIRGAKILMEKGIDVGIRKIGQKIEADTLFYPEENEYVRSGYIGKMAYQLSIDESAVVVTYASGDGNDNPDAFLYQNGNGQRFLVYAFDAANLCEDRYRSYSMQRQLYTSIEWLAKAPLPVKCQGNPDLYIICKKSDTEMSIGLWNFFPDRIDKPIIELEQEYETVEFVNCAGEKHGKNIKLGTMQPYEFAFINFG